MQATQQDRTRELLKQLRQEANDVKECVTRYSFQTIAISVAALGLIVRFQMDEPLVGANSVIVIVLVATVARICIYKYGTANRIFGYELFLHRMKYNSSGSSFGLGLRDRNIGWEESIKAWRVVQASVFEHLHEEAPFIDSINALLPENAKIGKRSFIYKLATALYKKENGKFRSNWGIIRLKAEHKEMHYKWFQVETLVHGATRYHSGSYLKTILFVLYAIAYISLIPIFISIVQYFFSERHFNMGLGILFLFIFLFALTVVFSRSKRGESRRDLLEDGFLSIHSCAIMWHAVMVAHYNAIRYLTDNNSPSLKGYVSALSAETNSLIEGKIENIHEWINR